MTRANTVWMWRAREVVVTALVLALALAACQNGGKPRSSVAAEPGAENRTAAPARPAPTVWFEPVDLSTSIGDTVPRIGVDNFGDRVDDALLSALAAAVTLHAWPEMDPVPVRVDTQNAVPINMGDARAYVSLAPTQALQDRWYALRVAKLPAGLAAPTFPGFSSPPDGSLVARFRTGSQPTLTAIRLCDKADGTTSTILDFSERIVAELPVGQIVSIALAGTGALSCTSNNQPVPPQGDGSLYFACPLIAPSATVEVALSPGLRSIEGKAMNLPLKALTDTAGSTSPRYTFEVGALAAWGAGCRMFRP